MPLSVFAQGIPSEGRDFYLGLLFPSYQTLTPHLANNSFKAYASYALISSTSDNHFAIKYYNPKTGSEDTSEHYFIAAHTTYAVKLDTLQMRMSEPGELQEWRAAHITADKPVTVQYFSMGACSGGSYLALPTQCLGRNYVVQSYHDNVNGVGGDSTFEDASSYFMIIAPYNGTTVDITPSATTKRIEVGASCGDGSPHIPTPFHVAFNQGQCFMVKSQANDPNCDLSGTTIIADKPIVVIAGNENAFVDASDPTPGQSSSGHSDARNYMVEQMLPVECWDSLGYFTIPFLDSPGSTTSGEGDEYRFFTGVIPELTPAKPPVSNLIFDGNNGKYTATAFALPPARVESITVPSNAHSTDNTLISVEMVDQRMQSSAPPFPAPEEMVVVPRSHWQNEYSWYVPPPGLVTQTSNFISLICRSVDYNNDSIMIIHDGKAPVGIKQSGLAIKKLWSTIPGGDDLIGLTMASDQGSYYAYNTATASRTDYHVPFMLYSYGMWGWDVNKELGDNDGDDYYWEYAHPAGAAYSEQGLVPHSTLSVTTQDECGSVRVCVSDTGVVKHYIRYIELLDYSTNRYVNTPPPSVNASISDGQNISPGEIILDGTQTSYCFTVSPNNPLDSMNASIEIYDNAGVPLLINVRSPVPRLGLLSKSSFVNITGNDTINFTSTEVGSHSQGLVAVINNDHVTHKIDSLYIQPNPNSVFWMQPLGIPVAIHPTESYNFLPVFTPNDTGLFEGKLILKDSCGRTISYLLKGTGGVGLIFASDTAFAITKPGGSDCRSVYVKNIGTLPFTLTGLDLTDPINFSIDSNTSGVHLPMLLIAGASITMDVCFKPQAEGYYSSTINWKTDIPSKFANEIKDVSKLTGRSSTNGVRAAATENSDLVAYIHNGNLVVELSNDLIVSPRAELFDLLGRKITEWNNISSGALPLPLLPSGLYVLRVSSGAIVRSAEVMKN